MRSAKYQRALHHKLEQERDTPYLKHLRTIREVVSYCYCEAWNLTWPHYQSEHDDDHDSIRELRARRAEGVAS
jgi:hypothetical protein